MNIDNHRGSGLSKIGCNSQNGASKSNRFLEIDLGDDSI